MAGTLRRGDPTGELVKAMTPRGTYGDATARAYAPVTVVLPIPASATGASWINPESGTILVFQSCYYFTTAGTGTLDIGITDDGTAAAANIIDGGTMVATIYARPDAASASLGAIGLQQRLVGPGGTGTNNSITVRHNEAATGTAVGALVFTYVRVGTE